MYILECADGSYYTGSTKDLERRLCQHQNGEGANYTKKRLPVTLVYFEEYERIDKAFYREKQVQGWSREKKKTLIEGKYEKLHEYAECKNETHFSNAPLPSAPLRKRSRKEKNVGQNRGKKVVERSQGKKIVGQNRGKKVVERSRNNRYKIK